MQSKEHEKFNVLHVPLILRNADRYKLTHVDKKMALTHGLDAVELEKMRVEEVIKNNLVTNLDVGSLDIDGYSTKCDQYYYQHAPSQQVANLLNKLIKATNFTSLPTNKKDAKNAWKNWVLEHFLIKEMPSVYDVLRNLKANDSIYCKYKKRCMTELGLPFPKGSADDGGLSDLLMLKVIRENKDVTFLLRFIEKDFGGGYYLNGYPDGTFKMLVVLPSHSFGREILWGDYPKNHLDTACNQNAVYEVLYGIKNVHNLLGLLPVDILLVSTLAPYQVYLARDYLTLEAVEQYAGRRFNDALKIYESFFINN